VLRAHRLRQARGFPILLALEVGEVDYEAETITFDTWPPLKAHPPTSQPTSQPTNRPTKQPANQTTKQLRLGSPCASRSWCDASFGLCPPSGALHLV
jgi:hypothetical protein